MLHGVYTRIVMGWSLKTISEDSLYSYNLVFAALQQLLIASPFLFITDFRSPFLSHVTRCTVEPALQCEPSARAR